VAIAARDDGEAAGLLRTIKSPPGPALNKNPIVIVAGGCSRNAEEVVDAYAEVLAKAFEDFPGTVLAGGTKSGIARIVGDLPDAIQGPILKLAYMPNIIPLTDRDQIHKKYQIHEVQTKGYTPLLAIQPWVDILKSGIPAAQIRLLGVNGGEISAFEYRLALAMGAKVGVVRGSGRAADAILQDASWESMPKLIGLPDDPQTIRLFVMGYTPSGIPRPVIEQMAREDHEESVPRREANIAKKAINKSRAEDPANKNWDDLMPLLQDSICQRIDHMIEKLRAVGRHVVQHDSMEAKAKLIDDPDVHEIEIMAEMEHARYNIERLEKGFRLGKNRDWTKMTNPTLIPWSELTEEDKETDRNYVRQGLLRLKRAGYVIIRPT